MAVTPTTLTELNDLAKDYYTEFYEPQMNTETALRAQFSRLENFQFTGRKAIFGIKTAVGGGASNAGANKSLPPAAQGKYDQGEQTLKRTYVRMALDLFLAEITKKQQGSYRPAVSELMDDRMTALQLEINRQMFCAGTGVLAKTSGTSNSTSQALIRDYGETHGGSGTRHVYEGDMVAFYQSDLTTLVGRRTVTGVNQDTDTITVDSTVQPTSGGVVAKSTSDDDNITHGEVSGLLSAMVQSGTFEAVPVGGQWLATSENNSGTLRDISDTLLMRTVLRIRARSTKFPDLAITRDGIVQNYSEIFLPMRRIAGQDVQLKGGYKPVAVFQHAGGQIPILTDVDAPQSRVFWLRTEYIKYADLVGEDWADMDGAQFSRIEGKDGVEGYIRKYWNLAYLRLNALGITDDLTDVAAIDRV